MGRHRARTGGGAETARKAMGGPRLGEAPPGPLALQGLRPGAVTPARTLAVQREKGLATPPSPGPKGASNAEAFVFAWALEGSDPYPPGEGPYDCGTDPGNRGTGDTTRAAGYQGRGSRG